MEKGYEEIFMIDAFDCFITGVEDSLESLVNEDYSMFLSTTPDYESVEERKGRARSGEVNTGFCCFRNTQETYEFIEDCRSVTYNNIVVNDMRGHSEQFVFCEVLEEKDKYIEENIVDIGNYIQQRFWFGVLPDFTGPRVSIYENCKRADIWEYGDFMLHFHGINERVNNYLMEVFYSEFYESL